MTPDSASELLDSAGERAPLPPSFLYVPGNKPELFNKALASAAGAIILDLEDSVPVPEKSRARHNVSEFLRAGRHKKPVWVRVNGVDHEEQAKADLLLPHLASAVGIFVPKLDLAGLTWVRKMLLTDPQLEGLGVIGLIETAKGLLEAPRLASGGLSALGIGRVDFLADLRVDLSEEMERIFEVYAAQVVLASAAVGINPPVAPAMVDLTDMTSTESTVKFRKMGFRSRTALHPVQCAAINSALIPSRSEYLEARKLIEQFSNDSGIFVTEQGVFVDEAVIRHARETVVRYSQALSGFGTGEIS